MHGACCVWHRRADLRGLTGSTADLQHLPFRSLPISGRPPKHELHSASYLRGRRTHFRGLIHCQAQVHTVPSERIPIGRRASKHDVYGSTNVQHWGSVLGIYLLKSSVRSVRSWNVPKRRSTSPVRTMHRSTHVRCGANDCSCIDCCRAELLCVPAAHVPKRHSTPGRSVHKPTHVRTWGVHLC
jgi:hypothetical protein